MLTIGVLVVAPIALANVVIGQSIAGVKLGDSKAQVKKVLGSPSSSSATSFVYPTKIGLRVSFQHGQVSGVLSFSKKQKTAKGITVGSSTAALKSAYPQATCSEGPYGPSSLYCVMTARFHGRQSYTSFLVGMSGTVEEIELGYGNGLS